MLNPSGASRRAEGPWSDLALHTIGWKAFQDLCSQVCQEVLRRPVEVFREAQDGGQDAVFLLHDSQAADFVVGTVQCKHSADPRRTLRASDLTGEFETVETLVAAGQAHTYVVMTSMSIDAPVAVEIRKKLLAKGVRKPHILGKQYLVRTIRSSPRLRALVPQVYGLGDLSIILDERTIEQSRALLDHWAPKLKVYVPTGSHRQAVRALEEHGIVLLLGNPSSGKSAIGAILSMMAADDPRHTVLTLTSPRDFEKGWNPNDPGRFFWIDDAFGSNVVREEYVQDWSSIFRKVQAALGHGNRFLLTSRRHVYEAAAARLGQRNFPLFCDKRAVVDVGDLSPDEKRQILYNHIAFGRQTRSWKRSVKPFLEAASQVSNFLPGIAERLGDPMFTKSLPMTEAAIIQFMEKPKLHLIDTINALDEPLRAALVLIYVHQGKFEEQTFDRAAAEVASDATGIPLRRILDSLPQLRGSFLKVDSGKTWGFAHPTISDALTDILKERPQMIATLLRGAPIHTVLSSCFCEGAAFLADGLRVPPDLNGVLVQRLVHTPDDVGTNSALFRFLQDRATDDVLRETVAADHRILEREAYGWSTIVSMPRFRTIARAARLGCVEESTRESIANEIEQLVLDNFDISLLDDEDLLRLIAPSRLVALGVRLQADMLPNASERISEIAEDVDLNYESESVFERFSIGLDALENWPELPDDTQQFIRRAQRSVERARNEARERAERDQERRSDTWRDISSHEPRPAASKSAAAVRSVFEDVDSAE
jgi:hypothetical protein